MNKYNISIISILLSLLTVVLFVTACASPPSRVTPAAAPTSNLPSVRQAQDMLPTSQEDAAWSKVVANARKEGRLTIYSFNFLGDGGLALGQAFKNRYGIDVDIITGRGAEFLERLKTEQRIGKMLADVVEGSNIHSRNMKLGGLTETLASLPVLKEKDIWWTNPTFMDPDAHFLGFTRFYLSPWVNTRLVKSSEEPKSWYDVLQPRWRGKITLGDPNISNLAYYFFLFVEQKRLEPDFLKKLSTQDIIWSRGTMDSVEKVARGDVDLAVLTSGGEGANLVKEGAPIKAIDIKEGVIANLHAINVVKGAPHPAAGRLFINWILSDEGQRVWAEAKSIGVLRKGIPDPSPAGARLEPQNPLILTAEAGEAVSKAFQDKLYVPLFKR